ncbi:MAG: hypothetical protein QOH88_1776 [Verrucomicrobiota bacterium]|jgi:hypothetical protein
MLQIEKIREEIREDGECIVTGTDLRAFCGDLSVSGQWGQIAKIAIDEGWAFTFFPDGAVRFANL